MPIALRTLSALVFFALAACLFAALGLWQVQRLEWKTRLINDIQTAARQPVLAVSASNTLDALPWRRVRLEGQFSPPVSWRLYAPRQSGQGWRILSPFRLAGGGYVFVERGWLADSLPIPPPPAARIITGTLAPPPSASIFDPPPAIAANQWFAADLAAMSQAARIPPPASVILHAARPENGLAASPPRPNLRNAHLHYAITWFALCAITLLLTLAALKKGQFRRKV